MEKELQTKIQGFLDEAFKTSQFKPILYLDTDTLDVQRYEGNKKVLQCLLTDPEVDYNVVNKGYTESGTIQAVIFFPIKYLDEVRECVDTLPKIIVGNTSVINGKNYIFNTDKPSMASIDTQSLKDIANIDRRLYFESDVYGEYILTIYYYQSDRNKGAIIDTNGNKMYTRFDILLIDENGEAIINEKLTYITYKFLYVENVQPFMFYYNNSLYNTSYNGSTGRSAVYSFTMVIKRSSTILYSILNELENYGSLKEFAYDGEKVSGIRLKKILEMSNDVIVINQNINIDVMISNLSIVSVLGEEITINIDFTRVI